MTRKRALPPPIRQPLFYLGQRARVEHVLAGEPALPRRIYPRAHVLEPPQFRGHPD